MLVTWLICDSSLSHSLREGKGASERKRKSERERERERERGQMRDEKCTTVNCMSLQAIDPHKKIQTTKYHLCHSNGLSRRSCLASRSLHLPPLLFSLSLSLSLLFLLHSHCVSCVSLSLSLSLSHSSLNHLLGDTHTANSVTSASCTCPIFIIHSSILDLSFGTAK